MPVSFEGGALGLLDQGPEKHTTPKEYVSRGLMFYRRSPAAGPPPTTDFRWFLAGVSTIRDPRNIPLCAIPLCVCRRIIRVKAGTKAPRGGAWERRRPGPRSISPVDPPCLPPAHPVGWVGGGQGTVSRKRRPLKLLSVAILAQVTVQSVSRCKLCPGVV